MSTTKKGKLIHQVKPYDVQLKKLWRIGRECGRLAVHYRMGHTLQGMGLTLVPTDWTKVVSRDSNKDRSSSSSSADLQESLSSHSPVPSPSSTSSSSSNQYDEQPSLNESTSPLRSSKTDSNRVQTSSPPLSLSPPGFFPTPTVLLAQNTSGGLVYFPSIIVPVKTEPDDSEMDIKSLQECP